MADLSESCKAVRYFCLKRMGDRVLIGFCWNWFRNRVILRSLPFLTYDALQFKCILVLIGLAVFTSYYEW